MELDKNILKAMIDNNIKGAVKLSEYTGLSKDKCYRIMKGDKTIRLTDIEHVANSLGLKIKFIKLGEE